MKRTIISIILFLATQLVGIVLACIVIIPIEIINSGTDIVSSSTITSIYNNKILIINIIGLLISQILLFLILWKSSYFSPTKIATQIPIRPMLLSILLVISSLTAFDIINSTIDLPNLMDEQFTGMTTSFWGFVTLVITGPIIEEIVFRYIIIGEYINKYGKEWIGILMSALLFGVIHLNPAQIFFAFMAGLLFGWIYCKTGSLLPGIIGHILNNALAFFEIRYNYFELFCGENGVFSFSNPCAIVTFITSIVISVIVLVSMSRYYGHMEKTIDEADIKER